MRVLVKIGDATRVTGYLEGSELKLSDVETAAPLAREVSFRHQAGGEWRTVAVKGSRVETGIPNDWIVLELDL